MKAFWKVLPAWKAILLIFVLVFLGLSCAYAQDVGLEWDPVSHADHYKVCWGTSPGSYTESDTTPGTSYNLTLADDTYYFAVKAVGSEGLMSGYSREVCVIDPNDVPAPNNRGWGITTGILAGFRVFYHSDHETTPTLGPSDLIDGFIDTYIPIGKPLNLQPSGKIFKDPDDPDDHRPPVIIFIPCPGFPDPSGLGVGLHDEVNDSWLLAWDGAGNIQSDAENWVAAKPIPHDYDPANHNPATIEIQLYHFSGTQAALGDRNTLSGKEGGGGCFIDAAAPD